MHILLYNNRAFSLFLILLILFGNPFVSKAEETLGVDDIRNILSAENGAPDTEALIAIGNNPDFLSEVTSTPPPPVNPNAGRKERAKGASGAAIFGAVMGFTSCAMMMAAAAKMPPGPQRTMMMAQAMQQCGQAAQNLDTGDKNNNAADAVTSGPAKMPSVARPSRLATPTRSRASLPTVGSTDDSPQSLPEPTLLPTPQDLSIPQFAGAEAPAEPEFGGEELDFESVNEFALADKLPVVEQPRIGFDEKSDGQGNTPIETTVFQASGGGLSGRLPNGVQRTVASEGTGRHPSGALVGSAGGSGAGGGSGSGGSNKKFSLAGILGKYGKKTGGLSGGRGSDIVILPRNSKKSTQPKLNIFEYATYRYRKITYNEGRVRSRFLGTKAAAPRKTASF